MAKTSMELLNKTVVVVVTHDHSRIWTTKSAKGSAPLVIDIQIPQRHLHVREAQHHGGHETSQYDAPYFGHIAEVLEPVSEILLIGHGQGKANSAQQLFNYLEKYHPHLSKKVIGLLDENIPALTEQQILEKARHWFSQRFGVPVHYWQAV